jgi:hypothetical protein
MNIFGGGKKKEKPATPPGIDTALERVRELRRSQSLRGRASAMLVEGNQAPPTAKREVTGN